MNARSRFVLAICLVWLSLFINADACEAQDPLFKKYLNSDTDVVAWIDVSQFSDEEIENFKIFVNITEAEARNLMNAMEVSKTTRIYALGNAAQMIPQGCLVLFETSDPQALEKEFKSLPGWTELKTKTADRHLLAAISDIVLQEATETAAASDPQSIPANLEEGLKTFGGRVGMVLALKPEFQRLIGSFPGANEDPSVAKLITAISKLEYAFATQEGKDADWNVQLNFSAVDASQSFCRASNQFLRQAMKLPESQALLSVKGQQVTLPAESQQELFAKMFSQVKTGSAEVTTMNNLRQIVLAFHNFESAYQKFPPQALSDDQGNKLLSWRILILPFIDQQALYDQFKLDEPWDSPHNRQLISKMPEVYASGNRQRRAEQMQQGLTCFQAPLTPDTVMGRPGAPLTFANITDGTSNTLLFVEVLPEKAVPWTKPEDWTVDLENPLTDLTKDENNTFITSRVDGAVQQVSSRISIKALLALLTIDGGEVIPNPVDGNQD